MAEQRLIDANELKKGIMNHCAFGKEWDRTLAICEIDSTPTVDAMLVVHAHWELVEEVDSFTGLFTCSVCKYQDEHSYLGNVPFCWHCGARMDETRSHSVPC